MIVWALLHLGALSLHVFFIRSWRREQRALNVEHAAYNAMEDRRRAEFMSALTGYRSAHSSWSIKRGQA